MSSNRPRRDESGRRQETAFHHRNKRVFIPEGVMAVGLIVGAHGLQGEMKIEPHTDYEDRFAVGNTLLLGEDLLAVQIRTSRSHKGFQLIRIDGVDSRTDVDLLRGQWLFIRESDATSLEEDVYWIHDIVGLSVIDTEGRALGTVRNILQTGANDVYIIEPANNINKGREILLPAIAEVVQKVDLDARTITVELFPGLLDEEDG